MLPTGVACVASNSSLGMHGTPASGKGSKPGSESDSESELCSPICHTSVLPEGIHELRVYMGSARLGLEGQGLACA